MRLVRLARGPRCIESTDAQTRRLPDGVVAIMMEQHRRLAMFVGCCLFLCARTSGQTIRTIDPATLPRFEVASVKPNPSGAAQMIVKTPPSGVVHATNVNARFLIRYAFDIPDFLIVGANDWKATEHFEIAAKAPEGSDEAVIRAMFRALLADRFRLRAHTEPREMTVDVLTLAGQGPGPQLQRPEHPCRQPPCHPRARFGHLEGTDVSLADLASALTVNTRRVVVDRTGLGGRFDFALTWTPDAVALDPSVRADFPSVDPDGPSLATALLQQLGMRLQRAREPVDRLVIDHIEHPDPD